MVNVDLNGCWLYSRVSTEEPTSENYYVPFVCKDNSVVYFVFGYSPNLPEIEFADLTKSKYNP
jgi:hypothetical protein